MSNKVKQELGATLGFMIGLIFVKVFMGFEAAVLTGVTILFLRSL